MGKEQHVAIDARVQTTLDDPVGPHADLLDRLAPRHGPVQIAPVGDLRADVGRRPTLELAVIPLAEVRIDERVGEPRQSGGLRGSRARAREDERERVAGEPAGERLGLSPPDVGQRDVAAPGMAPGRRPLGLAVADEPDLAFRAGGSLTASASGRTLSSGVAAKNSRGLHPKSQASGSVGTVEIRVL